MMNKKIKIIIILFFIVIGSIFIFFYLGTGKPTQFVIKLETYKCTKCLTFKTIAIWPADWPDKPEPGEIIINLHLTEKSKEHVHEWVPCSPDEMRKYKIVKTITLETINIRDEYGNHFPQMKVLKLIIIILIIISILLIAIYLFVYNYFYVGPAEYPPHRPKNLPEIYRWAGGPDGGNWIYIKPTKKKNIYYFKIYTEDGKYISDEGYCSPEKEVDIINIKDALSWYNGEKISFQNGKVLKIVESLYEKRIKIENFDITLEDIPPRPKNLSFLYRWAIYGSEGVWVYIEPTKEAKKYYSKIYTKDGSKVLEEGYFFDDSIFQATQVNISDTIVHYSGEKIYFLNGKALKLIKSINRKK